MKIVVSKDFHVGHWNHRVIRHVCKRWKRSAADNNLEIVEMHYDKDESPRGHGPTSLTGDNPAELQETVERMLRAVLLVVAAPESITDCRCDATVKAARARLAKRKSKGSRKRPA